MIPLRGKDSPYTGWPTMANGENDINFWNGSGAAVRMKGSDLFVIDLDVHVAGVRDRMLAWLTEHHPEFMAKCLRRHSEAVTLALIGRCVTARGTQKTFRYVGGGTTPKGDFVEVFTGNVKRYVGVAGVHSRGREYDYYGRHITETPVDDLPWLADANIAPMLTAFEQIMADLGWEKVIPVIGKDAIGTKVYDLEPWMIFTLADGERIDLVDLEEYARAGIGLGPRGEDGRLRGYADLWDPSTGNGKHSSGRVLVSYGSEGLCLYDTKYEVKHRWKHREPSKQLAELAELAASLRELAKGAWS